MRRADLDFVEMQPVPEIWFDEVARLELLDDGIVRLWLTAKERQQDGYARVLVVRMLATEAALLRNLERITPHFTKAKPVECEVLVAVH